MNAPQAVLSLVTLGVSDLNHSIAFYEALGFKRRVQGSDGIGFFQAGACAIAVWPSLELAKDADLVVGDISRGFRGVSLAWNCRSKAEVDATLDRACRAGATIQKPAGEVFWGGYTAYFCDPDGHLWEIAYNPHFALIEDGRLTLPD